MPLQSTWRRGFGSAAVLLGLGGVVVGLVMLERVFMDERRTAGERLAQRQQAIALYARESLLGALAHTLREAEPRIALAETDVLVEANDLLLFRADSQRLPRRWNETRRHGREVIDSFEVLAEIRPHAGNGALSAMTAHTPAGSDFAGKPADEGEVDPWSQRLALRDALSVALQRSDTLAIERGVRAILAHRARYVLPARRDVPFTLAVVALLTRHAQPSQLLLRGLLHEGIAGRDRRVPGLDRIVLERRAEFSAEEFAFLRDQIAAWQGEAGLSPVAFVTRADERPAAAVQLPADVSAPVLLREGWYVEPRPDDQVLGIRIDLDRQLERIRTDMRRRTLIAPADALRVEPGSDRGWAAVPLASLELAITSASVAASLREADRLFRTKTALVVVCALLLLGLLAMAAITQRRKQRLVDLKSRFVAAVSHELRTPLASTRLMAETLQRRLAGDPRAADYPERIIRDVEGLGALVDNVLSFSRLQKGQLRLNRTCIEADELMTAVRAELALDPRPGALTVNAEDGTRIEGDRELLGLLFANLARNAVQHNTSEEIKLDVRIESHARTSIAFADNGAGIPRALWKTVFEDFERGASTRSRGSGLGLALCREIAQLHGGSVTIESSDATGSVFRIDLPAPS